MSRFLQHIYVERYGGLADRQVGPFGPGLNVVYGPNEAGKSTLASLVGGVLFGWEGAHGVRNTYHPAEGGRAGRLSWAERFAGIPRLRASRSARDDGGAAARSARDDGGAAARSARDDGGSPLRRSARDSRGAASGFARDDGGAVLRSDWDETSAAVELRRDEQEVSGDLSVVDDLDRATFNTIFSLTADELRTLRNSSDVTARLLTAGTGTASSPAAAFVEVEQRIASTPVYRLEAELEVAQERVKAATEQVKLYIQEDRELRELEASRTATAERVSTLDAELEELIARRAELDAAEVRAEQLSAELANLRAERDGLTATTAAECTVDPRLLALDSPAERVLRDRLDDLAEEHEKVERALDIAKENSSTSSAAYEALCELDDEEVAASRRLRNRTSQAVVSVLLPIAFILAGIPLFAHGREINSLSFTAFGVGLVVVAVFLAIAAFFVLFRQPSGTEGLDARRTDAQWVMLQDRKKLDTRLAEQAEFEQRVATFLAEAGLGAAEGSIRQARSLLDEAHEARAVRSEDAQKAAAADLRIGAAERELAELRERIGGTPGSGQVTALLKEKTAQREALLAAAEDMSRRVGELTRELAFARDDRTLDQVKLEYQQLRVRLREAKHELISLLLAKRMLERSIATWESQSQPEVNALAGRLLATITDGRWVQVATSPTGSLVAVGADGVARDPRHLSLGTCQQLYLALRIALLLTADDVGRDIPVLADDILVNFDAARRRGAARALAQLAQSRQVIVFTCHEETAAVLEEVTADIVRVDL